MFLLKLTVLILASFGLSQAANGQDKNYFVEALNGKVDVHWIFNNNETDHIIGCILPTKPVNPLIPLPSLKWMIGKNKKLEDFSGNESILVDTGNSSVITMTFKKMSYEVTSLDYHCISYNPNSTDPVNKTITDTYFIVNVNSERKSYVTYLVLGLLGLFLVMVVIFFKMLGNSRRYRHVG